MAKTTDWKKTMRKSNALGWLALFALVAAIGIDTVIFGKGPEKPHNPVAANQAAPANPVK